MGEGTEDRGGQWGSEQGGGCRLLEDIEERRTVGDRTGRRV